MESHIVSEQEMTNYMNKMHYMVIFPDKKIELLQLKVRFTAEL